MHDTVCCAIPAMTRPSSRAPSILERIRRHCTTFRRAHSMQPLRRPYLASKNTTYKQQPAQVASRKTINSRSCEQEHNIQHKYKIASEGCYFAPCNSTASAVCGIGVAGCTAMLASAPDKFRGIGGDMWVTSFCACPIRGGVFSTILLIVPTYTYSHTHFL